MTAPIIVSLVEPGTERGHDDHDNIGTYDIAVTGIDEDGQPARDDMLGRDVVRLTAEELQGWRSIAHQRHGHQLAHGLARNRYMVAAVMMLDEARGALAALLAETEMPVRMGLVHVCFACDETQPNDYDPETPTPKHRPSCAIAAARALLDRDRYGTSIESITLLTEDA